LLLAGFYPLVAVAQAPPQPTSLSTSPATVSQGQCYTMTVGNGAGMTLDVQYTFNNGAVQTIEDWPVLDSSGQATPCTSAATAPGTYNFVAIRNTDNEAWVTVSAPVTVTAPTGYINKEYIYIGGKLLATEEPGGCTYFISPSGQSFSSASGTGTVSVTAPAGCSWTATSNATWITVSSGGSGTGNGPVNYSVAANSGPARTGTMTIAAFTFTVNQAAPPPTAPANLVATAASSTQVNLTWTASTSLVGISHYQVERRFNNGPYSQIGTATTTSFPDSSLSSGTAYLYRVRAVDTAGGVSPYSNVDLATAIQFTDDPLVSGATAVKAQHFTEMRQAVNAVRASAGLSAAAWTDTSLAGVVIKAVHVQEMRNNLNSALSALGLSTPSYTDPTLTTGVTPIRKVHLEELRQRVK
jgi:hypothetical protein